MRLIKTVGPASAFVAAMLFIECHESLAEVDRIHFISTPAMPPVTGPVSVIDSRHVWIGLAYTADGGTSWTGRLPPEDLSGNFLTSPPYGQTTFFITAKVGWLSGANSVWATTDGGTVWERTMPGHIHAMAFSAKHGWMAVGNEKNVDNYVSNDLGEHWMQCGVSWNLSDLAPLSSASFISQEEGWITVANYDRLERPIRGGVARTMDGGCTWKILWREPTHRSQNLAGIQFVDRNSGWLFGSHGALLETKDGGTHWVEVALPKKKFNLESAFLVSGGKGWVLEGENTENVIYYTANDGKKWNAVSNVDLRGSRGIASALPPTWGDAFLIKLRLETRSRATPSSHSLE